MKKLILMVLLAVPIAAVAQNEHAVFHNNQVLKGEINSKIEALDKVVREQKAQIEKLTRELHGRPGVHAGSVRTGAAEYIYCLVNPSASMSMSKVCVDVDYGQPLATWENNELRDSEGRPLEFNSMVNALNWFAAHGWEFVESYADTSDGSSGVRRYMLRKDISGCTPEEVEEAYSIFLTKKDFKRRQK